MPPACLGSLPLELRQMIWQMALEDQVESRTIIIHRATMRVLPHKTARSLVMEINQESRNYALDFFYDSRVEVHTLAIDFDPAIEAMSFGSSPQAQYLIGDRNPLDVYRGLHGEPLRAGFTLAMWLYRLSSKLRGDVLNLLRTPSEKMAEVGNGSGQPKGTIYLSSQRDTFALSSTQKATEMLWLVMNVDMCERAFLRDFICHDLCQALDDEVRHNSINFNFNHRPANLGNEFLSRYIGGRLPHKAVQRIRRVVHFHADPQPTGGQTHICGTAAAPRSRDWKLGAFKGAQKLYTAQLTYIASPAAANIGIRNLIEWSKTDTGGQVSFACTCQNSETQEDAQEVAQVEVANDLEG